MTKFPSLFKIQQKIKKLKKRKEVEEKMACGFWSKKIDEIFYCKVINFKKYVIVNEFEKKWSSGK